MRNPCPTCAIHNDNILYIDCTSFIIIVVHSMYYILCTTYIFYHGDGLHIRDIVIIKNSYNLNIMKLNF